MTTKTFQSRALAALGHDARLEIYRLLVRKGHDGLPVGEIGQHLGLAPSTLAHHLAALVDVGLVAQEKRGREVLNKVDYSVMLDLVRFLTSDCCDGVTLSSTEEAA